LLGKTEKSLGPLQISPLGKSDFEYRKFQKKSIVAGCDIRKGEKIIKDKIRFMRSPIPGLPPSQAKQVLGRKACKDIKQFKVLSPADVDPHE